MLKEQFKDQPAGYWVTWATDFYGMKLIALAYAWSHIVVSYILSTCGSKEPSGRCYMSYIEVDFRNVGSKEVSYRRLAHLIYD
jgi:hypothetical protein